MLGSLKLLDRILRGEMTRPSQLQDGKLTFPIFGVSFVGLVLAMVYGACMGLYSIIRVFEHIQSSDDYRQLLASTVKTPALFFLTLVVTFPSLYVFNALVGSRLQFGSVLRLLLAALGVNLAVLASFGPIVAFFSLSTDSYGFMVLLNVAMFAVAGLLGLMFLIQTLNRLQHAQTDRLELIPEPPTTQPAASESAPGSSPGLSPDPLLRRPPIRRLGPIDSVEGQSYAINVKLVFGIWIFVFGIVGAQMGWILRPFIGSPNQEFTWFRPRDSNFFSAVSTTFYDVMFGSEDPKRPRGYELERRGAGPTRDSDSPTGVPTLQPTFVQPAFVQPAIVATPTATSTPTAGATPTSTPTSTPTPAPSGATGTRRPDGTAR